MKMFIKYFVDSREYVANGYTNDLANQWFKHITTPEKWEFFNISDILTDYIMTDAIRKVSLYYILREKNLCWSGLHLLCRLNSLCKL